MRDEIADLVYPVFTYGLRLKERVAKGDRADLATEQAALKGLLGTDLDARRHADYGGEGGSLDQSMLGMTRPGDAGRRGADAFLGIRYALACWLDEIFILDSDWSAEWNEHSLEVALYRSRDRAWKFWEQAVRAESRPGGDALEVFYLCVMLGFRGERSDQPDKLRGWINATQSRIARSQEQDWPLPPEGQAPTNVPPLRGREGLQRMILLCGLALLLIIPFVAFFVVKQLGEGR